MAISSVKTSRAGDAFHYRWAARRCLKLVDPKETLKSITIEGSKAPSVAGEHVIDLAEYSRKDGVNSVAYYQLKHTTVRRNKDITLSELKHTISGFAKRYANNAASPKQKSAKAYTTSFHFITNRPISNRLKKCIDSIVKGSKESSNLRTKLEKITHLKGEKLGDFFASFRIVDDEGDYVVQREKLQDELTEYIVGFIDSLEVDRLINLVSEKVMPDSNGEITREDVLRKLGVTSDKQLFPAPPAFEKLPTTIKREQHEEILNHILTTPEPTIIHATGGVGKSVVARQIAESLPHSSVGILYDCFGAGKYRNPSEPRHRAYDALTQMANEMMSRGLCMTMIGHPGMPTDALFRAFLERVKKAVSLIRKTNKKAILVLLIDAADNAEMAADEVSEQSFAKALLRQPLPEGCRLVAFCRTERIHLLSPSTKVRKLPLKPFSKTESRNHLLKSFPKSSQREALEFHRLTAGNPRVQANALVSRHHRIEEVLASLGPERTTVNKQIAEQLESAVSAIKDNQTSGFATQVEAICYGLANLPPFIPLEVLAAAAKVDVSTIQSFVTDLGRPLWLWDEAVQFRDEPTETWFREKFAANPDQIRGYVSALEPLAERFTYVSKTLPQLLLKCKDYDRLVSLALSDEQLPKDNPIDERDIRVYRLQFAFKAALRLQRMTDAARLALRAGEEVAGNQRQLDLLKKNVDLIAPLQDAHRVQELAYRQFLRSGWAGSENLYSASLLSSVKDFHGEAQSYLRSARKWLQIYFEEGAKHRKTNPDYHHDEQLKEKDIAEFTWIHLNLTGTKSTVDYVSGWKPPRLALNVGRVLANRLLDAGRFAEINEIIRHGAKNLHLMLGLTAELADSATFPSKKELGRTLRLLSATKRPISKPQDSPQDDAITPAIVSFAEACAFRKLSKRTIISLLDFYAPAKLDRAILSDYLATPRRTTFRALALREVLRGNLSPDPKSLLPELPPKAKPQRPDDEELRKMTDIAGRLLPLYTVRARLIVQDPQAIGAENKTLLAQFASRVTSSYNDSNDRIPFEASHIYFETLTLNTKASDESLNDFIAKVVENPDARFTLYDRLSATYAAFRLPHLVSVRNRLESSCRTITESLQSDGPEERAGWYVQLARAVLPVSKSDAAAYFSSAVEAVSKFGDEMIDRWEALVSIARRSVGSADCTPKLAYRFVRCAEIIGDTVVREKYWDRDAVFKVMLHLDAPGAFAALSRWQDRDVGWFGSQLKALSTEAVRSEKISPSVAWALTGFIGCNHSGEYAAECIQKEQSASKQQQLLDAAVRDFEFYGQGLDSWETTRSIQSLQDVATKFHLTDTLLKKLGATIGKRSLESHPQPPNQTPVSITPKPKPANWKKIFQRVNLLTPSGIETALANLSAVKETPNPNEFWTQVVRRVPAGKESEFLRTLLEAENFDRFDMGRALKAIPRDWKDKAAIKRFWPSFMEGIGRNHAHALSYRRSLDYWQESHQLSDDELNSLRKGMIQGFAESSELSDASAFFGFIGNISEQLSPPDASSLLDYALTRFERHIQEDFGDGPWGDWLTPPTNISDAVAGLIWACLGSPHAGVRWEAAHTVRRLVEQGCETEIASLINWMESEKVGAFSCNRFPFYNLHAKHYLLIALARVSKDDARAVLPHAKVFAKIALEGMPHATIQKLAAEIALTIQQNTPGTYTPETITRLQQVGKSPFPHLAIDRFARDQKTPWHDRGEVDQSLQVHFGYDFDRYWFPPLGRVFGVSGEQVEELATEIACNLLHIPNSSTFTRDPRQQLFNSLDRRRTTTWASHGEFPRVDNYSYYYSYHAILSVAAKLLGAMPVVRERGNEGEEDGWLDWIRRHLISRDDGKWLADRRDPSPIIRRAWTESTPNQEWLTSFQPDDFFDAIHNRNTLPHSLCVNGSWNDCRGQFEESITVETALISTETADALANALRSCEEFNCYLPTNPEVDFQQGSPFKLSEWIRQRNGSERGLDRFDPFAAEIQYPPDEVEPEFCGILNLTSDAEGRAWYLPGSNTPSLISELWSEPKNRYQDYEPTRAGRRVSASIDLLKELCKKTGNDLIFLVKIERQEHRHYSSRSEDDLKYVPPSHKVFIFSSNGTIREATKSHKLG
jgi:Ca2+-binding EF-hand superfamily protein